MPFRKPIKQRRLSVLVTSSLAERLEQVARAEERTLSGLVRLMLQNALDQRAALAEREDA